jgi:hypothetical protein
MENLDKSWEKLSQSLEAESHFSRKEILKDLRTESSQPIMTLLKNVRLKMYFGFGFIPLPLAAIFILKPLPVKLFMAAIALAYIIVSYFILKTYNSLKNGINLDQPTLEAIRHTKKSVNKILRDEYIFFVVTFPISLTGGFLAGLSAESGNIDLLFEDWYIWLILVGMHIVFFPLEYFICKWANNKQFGQYLQQLDDILEDAEKNGFSGSEN